MAAPTACATCSGVVSLVRNHLVNLQRNPWSACSRMGWSTSPESPIINDHEALKKEQEKYKEIPLIRKIDNAMVQRNYLQIKQDVQDIMQSEMERVIHDPGLSYLVITKNAY